MNDLRFVAPDLRRLDDASAEIIVCGMWQDARPLSGLAGLLDWRLAGTLSRLAKQSFIVGDVGEALVLPVRPRLPFDKLLVCGLGARASFGGDTFKVVLERIRGALTGLSAKKAIVELPGRGDQAIDAELAAEILLDAIGEEERDGLTFVEDASGQQQIEKHAVDRRRTAPRKD
jgi:hypothetical protein